MHMHKLSHADWTVLSITPQYCRTALATGDPVCRHMHLQRDKPQAHWNSCTGKHSFPISLQLNHARTHVFPFLLALCNPTYSLPTPTSLVTSHLPDQGQLSRPAALDVEAVTQHGHLCLSREISTSQGQRGRAPCGSMLFQPPSTSPVSLPVLSQTTPHVCRMGTRKSCKLNMSDRQICDDSWEILAGRMSCLCNATQPTYINKHVDKSRSCLLPTVFHLSKWLVVFLSNFNCYIFDKFLCNEYWNAFKLLLTLFLCSLLSGVWLP